MNIVRPSNAYCPGQLLHRVHPQGGRVRPQGEKLPLHGGGRAEKILHPTPATSPAPSISGRQGPLGTVYNAGPPEPTSIRRVVELTAKALDIPFDATVRSLRRRLGQDSRYWLESSAIRKDTGWEPRIGWSEGLEEMVRWGREHHRHPQGTGRPATR